MTVVIEDSDADPDAAWSDLSDEEGGFVEDGDSDPEKDVCEPDVLVRVSVGSITRARKFREVCLQPPSRRKNLCLCTHGL